MTPEQYSNPPAEMVRRGELRTLQLFLQAAHREGLLPTERFEPKGQELRWSGDGRVLCARGSVHAHGSRLSLTSPPWLEDERGREPLDLAGTVRLVAEFAHAYRPGSPWDALIDELEEAARVQAAAYLAAESRPQPASWADFEAWTPEGHNLHPGAKTRQGFTSTDMLAYAPDFSDSIELPWLAVSKTLLGASGRVPSTFHLDHETWAVPVHPWQREHILPHVYEAQWSAGLIRDLDREPVKARLSTSLRTVTPLDESLPILKLSVGSLMTSTERSMSRHTVRQGPVYSELLGRALDQEPRWREQVELLEESGGLFWSDLSDGGTRSRQLSLLFRERPATPTVGVPVPCSTLPQPSPSGTSVMAELFGRGEGALSNLRRYCELVIPFHVWLFQTWGVALEAHLQNCLVVWSEDGPERLWLRDWGGLRADIEVLRERAPDLASQLDPDSVTVSQGSSACRKLVACLFTNHLTEIVVGVSADAGLAEAEAWAVVGEVSAQALAPWRSSELARSVLDQPWPVKALLRMRLGGDGDVYSNLPNPLSTQTLARPTFPCAFPQDLDSFNRLADTWDDDETLRELSS